MWKEGGLQLAQGLGNCYWWLKCDVETVASLRVGVCPVLRCVRCAGGEFSPKATQISTNQRADHLSRCTPKLGEVGTSRWEVLFVPKPSGKPACWEPPGNARALKCSQGQWHLGECAAAVPVPCCFGGPLMYTVNALFVNPVLSALKAVSVWRGLDPSQFGGLLFSASDPRLDPV